MNRFILLKNVNIIIAIGEEHEIRCGCLQRFKKYWR